jgi:hypothetical protein
MKVTVDLEVARAVQSAKDLVTAVKILRSNVESVLLPLSFYRDLARKIRKGQCEFITYVTWSIVEVEV